MDVVTLAVAKKYTDNSMAGAGAVAGVPCKIQSIAAITGGNRVTFLWTDNNGDDHTSTMDVMNGDKGDTGATGATGKGIKSMAINGSAHLIVTYTDDTTQDAGEVPTVQADWNEASTTADSYIKNKPELGTASAKDYTPNVQPNNHDLVESNAVYNAINTALTSVYTPRGELTCAELTSSLLIAANVGNIYEMSDSGTTSDLFLQGAGVAIAVGSNVGIIQTGVDIYKFNLMANSFDLHDYQTKALENAISVGGVSQTTVEGALGALSTDKTDKVSSATNGNFAALDASGNLKDSGKKASDFASSDIATTLVNYINENGAINQFNLTLSNTKSVNTGATWDNNAFTYRGLTYTVNDDNIVITGTPTDNSFFYLLAKNIPAGRYTFGGLKDSANIIWDGGFWIYNGSVETQISTGAAGNKNDFTVDLSSYTFDRIKFGIKRKSNTLTNDTIKLFIRKADINIDVNAPYAKTNKELTDLLAIKDYSSLVTAGTGVSYNQYSSQVLKMGNLVQVNLVFATTSALSDGDTLFTLPSDLLSSRNSAYRVIPSTDMGVKVTVNPINGAVNLGGATSGAIANARICCTYMI